MFSLGIVGAGQFAPYFAHLFHLHPAVGEIHVTDVVPERAEKLSRNLSLAGTMPSFEEMLASDVDAVAIFTQRWLHGTQVLQALAAGKHVYSSVPMAFSVEEVAAILRAVEETGLTYMMGETSYYNPATVFARQRIAEGEFGRIFYTEGDYVHDMDLGFYDAYKFSGGDDWKKTASFPPMKYPTHSIGGILGAIDAYVVSVSCLGVRDERPDGVFDREVSQFSNDFSNATALFELSDGGVMRVNEMRRVGYPSHLRESRFRFFGTEASFEQLATVSLWQNKEGAQDVSELLDCIPTMRPEDPLLLELAPALRNAFNTGHARIHDMDRLPEAFEGAINGHEGSHQFLVDDFVRAVNEEAAATVDAWTAARFTVPGMIAHESALAGGARLVVPDFGSAPNV